MLTSPLPICLKPRAIAICVTLVKMTSSDIPDRDPPCALLSSWMSCVKFSLEHSWEHTYCNYTLLFHRCISLGATSPQIIGMNHRIFGRLPADSMFFVYNPVCQIQRLWYQHQDEGKTRVCHWHSTNRWSTWKLNEKPSGFSPAVLMASPTMSPNHPHVKTDTTSLAESWRLG